MQLADILRDIKPCDMERPYIFVSYSAEDKELVWRDVLEFQKRGYNVWLDEKNLDKTEDSWRLDALSAVEDMDCELVVFYVSRHSLISENCYLELEKTTEEQTQAIHFGPVKFIAVDVEEIGNIVEFARQVYGQVRQSELPKAEKSKQAVTLDRFIRNFFNSNNEKVRVHPKNEANRKMDYYEEIAASFPDCTRTFPISEELPEAETAPAAEAAPQPEPVRREEPDAAAPAEPEPAATAEETVEKPGQTQTKPEPAAPAGETVTEPGAVPPERTVYQAMILANAAVPKFRFQRARECTAAQLRTAVERFAAGAAGETVVGFLDTTVMSNGKSGVLLTDRRLYSNMLKSREHALDLWKIKTAARSEKSELRTIVTFEDGSAEECSFSIYRDLIVAFLDAVTALRERVPLSVLAAPAATPDAGRINAAVSAARQSGNHPSGFLYASQLSDRQIQGAIQTYAPDVRPEEIVCLWDTTFGDNGREGMLVAKGRLYYDKLIPGDYIELAKLKEVALDKSHVVITERDGYRRSIFFSIFAPGMYAFLKAITDPGVN